MQRFDFGPNYMYALSIYMVTAKTGAARVEDVDRPSMRVVAVNGTTTLRSAAASLKHTSVAPVTSVAQAIDLLATGQADAFALSRDSIPAYLSQVPGSTMTRGHFQKVGIAGAVQKGQAVPLAKFQQFMRHALIDGTVRSALDRAGFAQEDVADAPGQ